MTEEFFHGVVAAMNQQWPWRPGQEALRDSWLDRLWREVRGWTGADVEALLTAIEQAGDDRYRRTRPSVQWLVETSRRLAGHPTTPSTFRRFRSVPAPERAAAADLLKARRRELGLRRTEGA